MQHIVTTRKVDQLQPYPRNARVHSDYQVHQIAESIRRWGFTNPVLINQNDMIVAGHGRVLAAMRVGMEEIPCIVLPNLSGDELRAYIIADNQLALNASWDDEILSSELIELSEAQVELSTIGFSDDEIEKLKGDFVDTPFDYDPKDPSGNETKSDYIFKVICKSDEDLEIIFNELNDRGYVVKR